MNKLGFRTLVGGVAGILAWLMLEPSSPKVLGANWSEWEFWFTTALGALVGLAVGGYNGYLQGGRVHTLRGIIAGLFFGMIGIRVGGGLGGVVFAIMTGGRGSANLAIAIPARTLALAFTGAGLGLGIGASSFNPKKTVQGLIGGAIGGAIGGVTFDLIGSVVGEFILRSEGRTNGEVGGPSRAVSAVILGAAIALFIGLVERYARSAWLRQQLGRNEGREWSIDQAVTTIGRSETATIPLFGDNAIAPSHCAIQRQGDQYWLTDLGSPIGTGLNGQRIPPQQPVPLTHGATIGVSGVQLVFLLKNVSAPASYAVAPPEAFRPQFGTPPAAATPAPVFAPTMAVPAQSPLQPTIMASPSFTLVALDGPLAGQRFPVLGPMDLGRESVTVPLGFDGTASRRHASVSPSTGGLAVTDLGSSNGTFANGQRIQQAILRQGEMLKVGATSFRVE